MTTPSSLFRPCIDIHQGKVKQIVGSTFSLNHEKTIAENFTSNQDATYYAKKYQEHGLNGGHVIMLGQDPKNIKQAKLALANYPQGFHIGGGMNLDNSEEWLDLGAQKIIVTSYLFKDKTLDFTRLQQLKKKIGRERIVIDLSCRPIGDHYIVAINGWKDQTSLSITSENLKRLEEYTDELLIHAINLEGKKQGIDHKLIDQLAEESPIKWVYAGGINSLDDVDYIVKKNTTAHKNIGFTIGSSLNLFGGHLDFDEVIKRSHFSK